MTISHVRLPCRSSPLAREGVLDFRLPRPGDADAVLAGLAILDRLGAAPLAGVARRRLADLGVARPPRRTTLAHPPGLTEREAEVHALLRDGLTNAEIAERLVLSTRTVDHHVSAVLRKAGVSSRHELRGR